MVERWRTAPGREARALTKVEQDNSVYGLAKELIHPLFHWYNELPLLRTSALCWIAGDFVQ